MGGWSSGTGLAGVSGSMTMVLFAYIGLSITQVGGRGGGGGVGHPSFVFFFFFFFFFFFPRWYLSLLSPSSSKVMYWHASMRLAAAALLGCRPGVTLSFAYRLGTNPH